MKSEFIYVSYIKTTSAKLWQLFTTPELIKQWWGGGINVESDWKAGAPWIMRYEDGRAADVGEILEIDPPSRLVLRWCNESNPEMKKEGFSRCVIDLEEMDGAVKLTVTHGMDVSNSKFIEAVSSGWPLVLSNLKSLLEVGEIVFKERTDSYGRNG